MIGIKNSKKVCDKLTPLIGKDLRVIGVLGAVSVTRMQIARVLQLPSIVPDVRDEVYAFRLQLIKVLLLSNTIKVAVGAVNAVACRLP